MSSTHQSASNSPLRTPSNDSHQQPDLAVGHLCPIIVLPTTSSPVVNVAARVDHLLQQQVELTHTIGLHSCLDQAEANYICAIELCTTTWLERLIQGHLLSEQVE